MSVLMVTQHGNRGTHIILRISQKLVAYIQQLFEQITATIMFIFKSFIYLMYDEYVQ